MTSSFGDSHKPIIRQLHDQLARVANPAVLQDFDNNAEHLNRLLETHTQIEHLITAKHQELQTTTDQQSAVANVYFIAAIAWQRIKLSAESPISHSFSASLWRPGAGGSYCWGSFMCNVSSDQLPGKCSFAVIAAVATTTIHFWRDSTNLGTFVGGGIVISLNGTGGTGTWK